MYDNSQALLSIVFLPSQKGCSQVFTTFFDCINRFYIKCDQCFPAPVANVLRELLVLVNELSNVQLADNKNAIQAHPKMGEQFTKLAKHIRENLEKHGNNFKRLVDDDVIIDILEASQGLQRFNCLRSSPLRTNGEPTSAPSPPRYK